MAIKPIEAYDDDEYEDADDGLTTGNIIKTAFLMVIILFGTFFWWYSSAFNDEIKDRMAKAGVQPSPTANPTPKFDPTVELSSEAQDLLVDIKNESARILDSSMQQAAKAGENVLGDATKQVQNTASTSADMVTSTIYENTIGKVILQLFNTLPQTAKEGVAEDICKESDNCEVK